MTTKQPIPDEQKLALVNDAIEKLPLDLLQQVTEKRVGPMDWDAVLAEVERRGLDFYSWWTKFGLVEIMRFVRVDGGMMLRWFRSSGPQGGELPIDGNQPYPWTSKFQTCDTLTAAADCLKDWKRMLTAKTAAGKSEVEKMPDDWVTVPLTEKKVGKKNMVLTRQQIGEHCKRFPEVIKRIRNGLYQIRRCRLEDYLMGEPLKKYLES